MSSFFKSFAAIALFAFPAAASAQSSVVTVVNGSSWNIEYLYLSPTSTNSWGPDMLGSTIIPTGGAHTLSGVGCDNYDVRLIDSDGDECVVSGVSLCGEATTWNINSNDLLSCQSQTATHGAVAGASNSVQMLNQSGFTIHELYVSPSGSTQWGPDQLGNTIIQPGGQFTLTDIACGTYDVMMTDPYGGSCTVPSVSLCAGAEQWVLTDYYLSTCQ